MVHRLTQLYESLGARDLVQIAILAVVIYGVLHFVGRTCGAGSSIGRGLGMVVVGLFLLAQVVIAALDMTELGAVLDFLLTTGLNDPRVEPWEPAVMPAEASSVARQAPTGKPPPSPFATARTSGSMPVHS